VPYYDQDGITIYNADCRDILPLLPRVDLVLTDPPYGIGNAWSENHTGGFMSRQKSAELKKWDTAVPKDAISLAIEKAKEQIIWGGNYLGLKETPRVFVWDKCQQGMHFAEVEVAYVYSIAGTSRLCRLPLKSSEVFGVNSERQHPTQKPIKLMTWCLSFFPDAQTILDPFMGSGTTLVAAKLLGKKAIGIELEEKYCQIAVERLAQGNLFGAGEEVKW
jgi:DNA modification methylase